MHESQGTGEDFEADFSAHSWGLEVEEEEKEG